MGELTLWAGWMAGILAAQIYDPVAWVAFLIGAIAGKSRFGILIGAGCVLVVTTFGWMSALQHQFALGNAKPPLIIAIMFFFAKFFSFALGVAFNRLVLRIEKRVAGVLEKT